MIDYHQAMTNPRACFRHPRAVTVCSDLTLAQQTSVLREWSDLEKAMIVASAENMNPGHDRTDESAALVADIAGLLRQLSAAPERAAVRPVQTDAGLAERKAGIFRPRR